AIPTAASTPRTPRPTNANASVPLIKPAAHRTRRATPLARDGDLLQGGAQCHCSDAVRDCAGFVDHLALVVSAKGGENTSLVGERDRALVIEAEGRERLHRVEDELLGPRELAALHGANSLGLRQERAASSVTGALDDRLDALEERLIVDTPAGRGQDR